MNYDTSEWLYGKQDPSLKSKLREYWSLSKFSREQEILLRTRHKDYLNNIHRLLMEVPDIIAKYNYDNEADIEIVRRALENSLVPYCSFKLIRSLRIFNSNPIDIGILIYLFAFKAPLVVKELSKRDIDVHGFVSDIISILSDFWGDEKFEDLEELLRDHILNLIFVYKVNDKNLKMGILSFSWLIDIFGVNKDILFKPPSELEEIVKEKLVEMKDTDLSLQMGLKYRLTKNQIKEARSKMEELLAIRADRDYIPTFSLEADGFILRRISYDDPRQLFLGYNIEYSSCYQIRGQAKTALFYSISNPGAGNYEIVTSRGEPVLQWMLWTDSSGKFLCIDSLEKGTYYNAIYDCIYAGLLLDFGEKVAQETDKKGVLIGELGPCGLIEFFNSVSFIPKKHRQKTQELLDLSSEPIKNRFGLYDPIGISIIPDTYFYCDGIRGQRIIFCEDKSLLTGIYTVNYHLSTANELYQLIKEGDISEDTLKELIFHAKAAILLYNNQIYDTHVFGYSDTVCDKLYQRPYSEDLIIYEEKLNVALWHFMHIYIDQPISGYMSICQNIKEYYENGIDNEKIRQYRLLIRQYYETSKDLTPFYKDTTLSSSIPINKYVDIEDEYDGEWILSDSLQETPEQDMKDFLQNEELINLIYDDLEERINYILSAKDKFLPNLSSVYTDREVYTDSEIWSFMDANIEHDHREITIFQHYIHDLNIAEKEDRRIYDLIYSIPEKIKVNDYLLLSLADKNLEWGIQNYQLLLQGLQKQDSMPFYSLDAYVLFRHYCEYFNVHAMTNAWFDILPLDFAIALAKIGIRHSYPRKMKINNMTRQEVKEIISNIPIIFKIKEGSEIMCLYDFISSVMYSFTFIDENDEEISELVELPTWKYIDEFLSSFYNSLLSALTPQFKKDIIKDLKTINTDFWCNIVYDLRALLMGYDRIALDGVQIP